VGGWLLDVVWVDFGVGFFLSFLRGARHGKFLAFPNVPHLVAMAVYGYCLVVLLGFLRGSHRTLLRVAWPCMLLKSTLRTPVSAVKGMMVLFHPHHSTKLTPSRSFCVLNRHRLRTRSRLVGTCVPKIVPSDQLQNKCSAVR
jgi:hypothetical protein